MRQLADLVVRRPDGRPVVVVEVRNRKELSREVAAELRQFLITEWPGSQVPFFLLVSQDRGYLWTESSERAADSPPQYEFSFKEVISRYLPDWDPADRMRGRELEFLLFRWLIDIAYPQDTPDEEPEKSLAESGFIEAVRGAQISMQEAA